MDHFDYSPYGRYALRKLSTISNLTSPKCVNIIFFQVHRTIYKAPEKDEKLKSEI